MGQESEGVGGDISDLVLNFEVGGDLRQHLD